MKKLLIVLFAALMLVACGSNAEETTTTEVKGSSEIATDGGKVTTEVSLVDGKITAITIDEFEGETSKKELADDYNMKVASKIGKEWYEQIAYLENALIGTDGTIALDDNGNATSADIISGCTINLTTIAQSVSEAVANAK